MSPDANRPSRRLAADSKAHRAELFADILRVGLDAREQGRGQQGRDAAARKGIHGAIPCAGGQPGCGGERRRAALREQGRNGRGRVQE